MDGKAKTGNRGHMLRKGTKRQEEGGKRDIERKRMRKKGRSSLVRMRSSLVADEI